MQFLAVTPSQAKRKHTLSRPRDSLVTSIVARTRSVDRDGKKKKRSNKEEKRTDVSSFKEQPRYASRRATLPSNRDCTTSNVCHTTYVEARARARLSRTRSIRDTSRARVYTHTYVIRQFRRVALSAVSSFSRSANSVVTRRSRRRRRSTTGAAKPYTQRNATCTRETRRDDDDDDDDGAAVEPRRRRSSRMRRHALTFPLRSRVRKSTVAVAAAKYACTRTSNSRAERSGENSLPRRPREAPRNARPTNVFCGDA